MASGLCMVYSDLQDLSICPDLVADMDCLGAGRNVSNMASDGPFGPLPGYQRSHFFSLRLNAHVPVVSYRANVRIRVGGYNPGNCSEVLKPTQVK